MNKSILKKIHRAAWLIDNNKHAEAQKICLKMQQNKINHPDIPILLGLCYLFWHRFEDARQSFQRALKDNPEHTESRINLMVCYQELGQMAKSIELCQPFIDNPRNPMEAYTAFILLRGACMWYEADKHQHRIISDLKQGNIPSERMSNTMLYINELTGITSKDIYQIHCQWGTDVTEQCHAENITLPHTKPPEGRVKIAYLSVDFYAHPVGNLSLPIIENHDRERFEVFCYARIIKDDDGTNAFRRAADHFIDITALSPAQTAMRIASDGIHILVDLSGHTSHSPIKTLAFKPAPVQISYLGYPNTSGLTAIDFRITDPHCDAENGTRYVEQLLNMPSTFLCRRGFPKHARAKEAPADSNGFITFGSLNSTRKFNPQVIQAWASILNKVSNSKILIKAKGCDQQFIRQNILNEFALHNIDRKRIIFHGYTKTYEDHLEIYNQIDIALDTFPYHGTHTTCDSLWMGLPVITLVGKMHAQRVSSSILKCIGFESTIAYSFDEYIKTAVDLASRPQSLTLLRGCIHTLFKSSLIMNPAKITSQLEDLYLKAWEIKMGYPALTESESNAQPIASTELIMDETISIMLPEDLNQICTYVLTEQGDWYEDELRFLRYIAKPGMRVLDCSAEYGCYSLSLAKEVGSDGAVFALEKDANKRHAIEESAIKNSFSQLNTGSANDAPAFLKTGADIVLHAENGIDSNSVCFNISNESSPIVMIKAMNENGMDETLTKRMQQQGFNPYRLIPALNLLVPVPAGFIPTSWHQQLFFCKQDKAKVLANDGFLLLNELESIDLPDDLSYWQHTIEHRAYSNTLLPLWVEQIEANQTSSDWEQVRNALSAYAMAHHENSTAQQCFAYLSASLNILLNTEELQSSSPRLCTLARIAIELGNNTLAQQAIEMIIESINSCQEFIAHEPFLPISNNYDQDDYHNNLAEWVLAQALAQAELLKYPTSYFNSTKLEETALKLQTLGFPNNVIMQRIATNKTRNNPITTPIQPEEPLHHSTIPIDVPAQPHRPRRLHIGGKQAHPDWEIMDAIDGTHVDHIGNASDLSRFKDKTFDAIYSAHVLEHFGYREEIHQVLSEWYRVLKPGSLIYSSVPNLETMCEMFLKKDQLSEQDRFLVMRMIFGGQVNTYDFHKVGYNPEILTHFLTQVGFKNIRIVDSFNLFHDGSTLTFSERSISLNIIAEK